MVGSAKGRSMRVSMMRFPGKSSRTSIHATRVPKTTFSRATNSEERMVRRSAAHASGVVTWSQNSPSPWSAERQTTAPRGMKTRMLRYSVASPSGSPVPKRRRAATGGAAGTTGGPPSACVAVALAKRDPDALLDVGHDAAVRVEEVLAHVGPATELADVEEPGRRGELVRPGHALASRPVAVPDERGLRLLGAEVVEEGLGLLGLLGGRGDRHRVLDEDRVVRDDVVDVLALLLGEDRLVLVGEEHVTLATGEGLQGLPGAVVLDDHVFEEIGEVLLGLVLRLALLDLGAVGGHDVPPGTAGGEGVRGHDLDAVLGEVVPRVDAEGVVLPHDPDHDGVGDHPLLRTGVPVLVDDVGLDQPVHVRLEGELHHVGGEAALHGAALVARAPVGLRELDVLAGVRGLEVLDDLLVRLLRRRVRDEREPLLVPAAATAGDERDARKEPNRRHPSLLHAPLTLHSFLGIPYWIDRQGRGAREPSQGTIGHKVGDSDAGKVTRCAGPTAPGRWRACRPGLRIGRQAILPPATRARTKAPRPNAVRHVR